MSSLYWISSAHKVDEARSVVRLKERKEVDLVWICGCECLTMVVVGGSGKGEVGGAGASSVNRSCQGR